jgi:hypothetical protein
MIEYFEVKGVEIPEIFIGAIKLLCPRVFFQIYSKSGQIKSNEIQAIQNPLKAVFFNILAFQKFKDQKFLLEALVYSTRDDVNLEYFVYQLTPLFMQHLMVEEIFDCLIRRSNYRAQEYFYEEIMKNIDQKEAQTSQQMLVQTLMKFKPESDLTRLLTLFFKKVAITNGGWKLIKEFIGIVSNETMLKFIDSVVDQGPSLEDLKSITEFANTLGSERKSLILKIINATEFPHDNPLVFDLLREEFTLEDQEQIILEKLGEYENKGIIEVDALVPVIKGQLSNTLIEYLWGKYDRVKLLKLLGIEKFVLHIDQNFDLLHFENQIISQLETFEHLKVISQIYCTFTIFKKLLFSFENQIDYTSCVKEYDEIIDILNNLQIEKDDRTALERKIQWLANGILDKMERVRISARLTHRTAEHESIQSDSMNEKELMEHHRRAFESFKFEED